MSEDFIPPGGPADMLIASLRDAGQPTNEAPAPFSIDRQRAREMMARYRLASPHHYVLELVGAALHRGATAIRFEIDSTAMIMEFDGRPFTLGDFDRLYDSLFAEGEAHDDLISVQELAIALNSAAALRPRYIDVYSGNARLHIVPEAPDELGPAEAAREGTRIELRARGMFRILGRALSGGLGDLPEESALRKHCGNADTPIFLDGERVSRGMQFESDASAQTRIEEDGGVVVAAFSPWSAAAPTIRIICGGVWMGSEPLPGYPRGITVLASHPQLRKDLSRAAVVRDDTANRLLALARRGAQAALTTLGEAVADRQLPSRVGQAAINAVREAIGDVDRIERLRDGLPEALDDVLSRFPCWFTIDEDLVTLRRILDYVEAHGSVQWSATRTDPGGSSIADDQLVLHLDPSLQRDTAYTTIHAVVRGRIAPYEPRRPEEAETGLPGLHALDPADQLRLLLERQGQILERLARLEQRLKEMAPGDDR